MFKVSGLYVTNPLKFVEICCMAQQVVSFYKCTLYAVVLCTSPSHYWRVFLFFCFRVLSCQLLLNPLTVNTETSIYPCGFVHFCFIFFEAMLLGADRLYHDLKNFSDSYYFQVYLSGIYFPHYHFQALFGALLLCNT